MSSWLRLLAIVCGVSAMEQPRDGRWFLGGNDVTMVVMETRVITQVVPSSCVVVEPSLPACRMMRELTLLPSPAERIEPTQSLAESDGKVLDSSVFPSHYQLDEGTIEPTPSLAKALPFADPEGTSSVAPWSFKDLFRGFYSTVTQTVVEERTRRFRDKAHVVTFSVVGCLPTRMPFDLALCEEGEAAATTITMMDPR